MRKMLLTSLLLALLCTQLQAQDPRIDFPNASPAIERIKAFQQRNLLRENAPAAGIPFVSVGPSIMSGRVVDVEVNPSDASHFFVAYASGGLWVTQDNGISFTPLFDQQAVMTIGDIAVDWANTQGRVIWIGTGENNSSRSSYAGVGMYRSNDGGKTWKHKGLSESHHIGRIILHPRDTNTVWVATLGHLYSPNAERGVYKTSNAGTNWERTLYMDENSGAIDMVLDPQNPDVLYAALWHRERRAWNFTGSGNNSGIYKSTNGGSTWASVTDGSSFPQGDAAGRIGLAMHPNGTLYAIVDNNARKPKEEKTNKNELRKDDLRGMSKEAFLKLDEKKVKAFLTDNGFPDKYSYEVVKRKIEKDSISPSTLVEYLEDANTLLFETEVVGTEIYRSTDQGKSWVKTHEGYLDDVYYSYGYYFGQIRVAAHNDQHIYLYGVPLLRSEDGGKTFIPMNADNVHVDHHALWINPERPGHLILGNDGGINISYNNGKNWSKCNSIPVGQFYAVAVDMAQPYNIYGGLQDNGVWVGSSKYKASPEWQQTGEYPYKSIMGGDGMQIAIDPRDNTTVYTGYQFGSYYRLNKNTGASTYIQPQHELGERPLRFNWQTPIHLSVHNPDIIYLGSNKVHRSMNQGNKWTAISDDLTTGGMKGNVPYGTLSALHESSLRFGLLYAGSDDGLIHVSKDGGYSWTQITDNLPQSMWVSRVQASAHVESRVYCSLNGYRWDDFTPYVYISEDYGQTWTAIGTNLPHEAVNVIKEDPINPNILYVGTDHQLYVSLDRGKTFSVMGQGIPDVSVHDLVIHPRDKDIIVGTHGRSIYKASVKHLQAIDETIMAKTLHLFSLDDVQYRESWGQNWSKWFEADTPSVQIPCYLAEAGQLNLKVKTSDGLVLSNQDFTLNKGLNYLPYNLKVQPSAVADYQKALNKNLEKDAEPISFDTKKHPHVYLRPGTYELVFKVGKTEEKLKLKVKE
jgi:photosystem II stability/assembly factor-like uncharacterized protein